MSKWTKKEVMELGKDIIRVKVKHYTKHGYDTETISDLLMIPERSVQKIINELKDNGEL